MVENAGIFIVGLGAGGGELLTRQAWDILSHAPCIYLRTQRHPAVEALPAHIPQVSFDALYETAAQFADVYAQIADTIVATAQNGTVVYAVPGHPAIGESTVTRIRQLAQKADIPVHLIAGLSFLEPTLSALQIDGLDGLQLFDGMELADQLALPINPDVPALLAQVYNRLLANHLKLALMTLYPPEHQVALIHAAGTTREQVEWLPLYQMDWSEQIDHLTSLYLPPTPFPSSLTTLAQTVATLRSPNGCPWDQEQTAQSLRPDLVEEMAEVLEALDTNNAELLCEELGDLLFHIVMQTQIATEEEAFTLSQVIANIDAKLKRRHPHVWGDWQVKNSQEVIQNWERLKAQEKADKNQAQHSILDNIPPTMPALAQSQKIQNRVRKTGFDWDNIEGVYEKLEEERTELLAAQSAVEKQAELGDLLFVVVNLASWLKVDAETALREANLRFSHRFRQLEQLAIAQQLDLAKAGLDKLNQLWDEAKLLTASDDETMEV